MVLQWTEPAGFLKSVPDLQYHISSCIHSFFPSHSLLLINKQYLCIIYQSERDYVIIPTKLLDNE
ncbi:hypothetical protein BACEGG_01278 [Bacteroides eggerthii DSM 20697]|nr:hypothetical protein BACEGG_01278 [Bacteroides eggerthii DSM 20697]